MPLILLTQQERDKFAAYLLQEAESDDGMAKQMEKLKGHEAMVKRLRQRGAIYAIVAKELQKIEEMTIEA